MPLIDNFSVLVKGAPFSCFPEVAVLFSEIMIMQEIATRRSIRRFTPRPIAKEILHDVLEAGRLAPTARNQQEWQLIVVDDPARKEELVDACSPHQPFIKAAPLVLVACATNPDYVMRCGHPAFLLDLAIVLDHITLQAEREGLGSCWIGSFDEGKAKEVLGIPAGVRVVLLMPLGYPAENPPPRPRKEQAKLIRINRW
jgi:nitroreductase